VTHHGYDRVVISFVHGGPEIAHSLCLRLRQLVSDNKAGSGCLMAACPDISLNSACHDPVANPVVCGAERPREVAERSNFKYVQYLMQGGMSLPEFMDQFAYLSLNLELLAVG
jgi:hypothetical protein